MPWLSLLAIPVLAFLVWVYFKSCFGDFSTPDDDDTPL